LKEWSEKYFVQTNDLTFSFTRCVYDWRNVHG